MYKGFFLIVLSALFLQGCAHSNVQRSAACQIDAANVAGQSAFCNVPYIGDTYQSSNQASKGFWVGGATGALTGALASTNVGIVPGAIIGAILGGAYGAYIDENTNLVDRIQNQGAKVYILGDQILIVIRSTNIFCCGGCEIRPGTCCPLYQIVQLINLYPNIGVHVAAFASENMMIGEKRNIFLTQKQAESVERFLWKACVNTRLITSEGKGSAKLVQMSSCSCWNDWNDRIEITLERLPC